MLPYRFLPLLQIREIERENYWFYTRKHGKYYKTWGRSITSLTKIRKAYSFLYLIGFKTHIQWTSVNIQKIEIQLYFITLSVKHICILGSEEALLREGEESKWDHVHNTNKTPNWRTLRWKQINYGRKSDDDLNKGIQALVIEEGRKWEEPCKSYNNTTKLTYFKRFKGNH